MISAFIIAVFTFVFGGYVIPEANATRIEFEHTFVDPRKKKLVIVIFNLRWGQEQLYTSAILIWPAVQDTTFQWTILIASILIHD